MLESTTVLQYSSVQNHQDHVKEQNHQDHAGTSSLLLTHGYTGTDGVTMVIINTNHQRIVVTMAAAGAAEVVGWDGGRGVGGI